MSIPELREQMSEFIKERNKVIEKMKYHDRQALLCKNEANSLNVKIELRNNRIANERTKS